MNILGFRYLNCDEYHSSYSILEDKRYEKFTDKLSIHIFELPKVPKEMVSGDNKQQWMELIRADSEEALEMVRTTSTSPEIQKGIDKIYELNADTVLREQIRQRDKAIRDYENDMAVARSEGRSEGITEGLMKALEVLVRRGLTEDEAKKELGLA